MPATFCPEKIFHAVDTQLYIHVTLLLEDDLGHRTIQDEYLPLAGYLVTLTDEPGVLPTAEPAIRAFDGGPRNGAGISDIFGYAEVMQVGLVPMAGQVGGDITRRDATDAESAEYDRREARERSGN